MKYVKNRHKLTELFNQYKQSGYMVYRVRIPCGCNPVLKNPDKNIRSNQRNGLIILSSGILIESIIRCKVCASEFANELSDF
jgi:hypothetical protein